MVTHCVGNRFSVYWCSSVCGYLCSVLGMFRFFVLFALMGE